MTDLLLISHPGHELRVLGWVRRCRPKVVILTQGEGAEAEPRIGESLALLAASGIDIDDPWLESVPDQHIYSALLGRARSPFPHWLAQLEARCIRHGVRRIVADSAEGYNPSHDLCRSLANALVVRLAARGRAVDSLEFPLDGHPFEPCGFGPARERIALSEGEVSEKLELARAYAARTSRTLLAEIDAMCERFGETAFASEVLFAARPTDYEQGRVPAQPPHFETVGEQRQAAGVYADVIRATHLLRLCSEMHGG